MAAAKKPLFTVKLGKASGWLPAVAVFLCLSMFAIAALVLFQVGADPQSPPSGVVTSVSAQGFQGLRRLLDAEGHLTAINRFEDDGPVERGDLEIITLDNAYNLITTNEPPSSDADDSAVTDNDADYSDPAASSAAAASNRAAAENARAAQQRLGILADPTNVPDKKRVDHILYHPLGKAVLVVVPKWESRWWPKNPRWAQAPSLSTARDIADTLMVLSPVTEKPTTYGAEGTPIPVAEIPGRRISVGADKTMTSDLIDYTMRRNVRPAPPKALKPNPNHDPMIDIQNQPDPDIPVAANVVLAPAPGQALFTTPIRAGRILALQSIAAPNLVPVLVTADGQPILSRLIVTDGRTQPKVPVYVLSEPDLLNNQILADPQKVVNALALIDIVTRSGAQASTARSVPGDQSPSGSGGARTTALGHSKIVFNMTYNGLSFDRDLLHALSRPPFVAVPLAMLILGLALMWAAFARFGPAEVAPAGPPLGRGVRTLADNAARLMALTLKETRLGPAYATLMRDIVIRGRGYMQVDPTQSLDDLAERIGKTHGATDSYLDLRDKAARVATVHQLIDVTLKLHAWKTEIERAHI